MATKPRMAATRKEPTATEIMATKPGRLQSKFGNEMRKAERVLTKAVNKRLATMRKNGYDEPAMIKDLLNENGRVTMSKPGQELEAVQFLREFLQSPLSSQSKIQQNKRILQQKFGREISVKEHQEYVSNAVFWDLMRIEYEVNRVSSDEVYNALTSKLDEGQSMETAMNQVMSEMETKAKHERERRAKIEEEYRASIADIQQSLDDDFFRQF